jgi:hypothetical protein
MDVAIDVLTAAGQKEGAEFVFTKALIGGAAVDAANDPYPAETEAACKASDAVLLAAIGGYKWDDLPYECVACSPSLVSRIVGPINHLLAMPRGPRTALYPLPHVTHLFLILNPPV